jgi:uncharacterized protein (DUF1684 family)
MVASVSLEEQRQGKDEFFARHPQSPLTAEQRRGFKGLRYYDENAALRLRLPLQRAESVEHIIMDTSTGDQRSYVKAGSVRFEVDGEAAEIVLYADPDSGGHEFFVPFRDATSGKETYGAGRYLEAELLEDGNVDLDFNLSYNPYCAYNDRWSCPLPPIENWLKVPIRAGEMAFEEGH